MCINQSTQVSFLGAVINHGADKNLEAACILWENNWIEY